MDLLATDLFKTSCPSLHSPSAVRLSAVVVLLSESRRSGKRGKIFLGEVRWSRPYRCTKKHVLVTNAWTKLCLEYILIIRPSGIVDMSDANGTCEV